jgi:hypothetical protein
MKVKSGFLLRCIAGSHVIVPIGDRVREFNGIITVNETGAFLWKQLEKGAEEDDLVHALMTNYDDVDEPLARRSVAEFLQSMKEADCFE